MRPRRDLDVGEGGVDAVLSHETQLRIIGASDIASLDPPVRVFAVVAESCIPRVGVTGHTRVVRLSVVAAGIPFRCETHSGVCAVRSRVPAQRRSCSSLDIGEKGAHVGSVPEILLNATHERVGSRLPRRLTRLDGQGTEVRAAQTPRQLQSRVDRDRRAGFSSSLDRPILREKKGRVVLGLPNAKIWDRCRKNSLFSGKKSADRPKLNCCASVSVSAKSVFTVRSASVDELIP